MVTERGPAAASVINRARTVGFNETVLKLNTDERNLILTVQETLRQN